MRVLIIEDDSFYAQFIAEFLKDNHVESTVVQSAEEALAIDVAEYAGAVVDVMLPNDPEASGITLEECRGGYATGIAVARRLHQRYPALRLLFLSSGIISEEAEKWADEHSIPFVRKSDSSHDLK